MLVNSFLHFFSYIFENYLILSYLSNQENPIFNFFRGICLLAEILMILTKCFRYLRITWLLLCKKFRVDLQKRMLIMIIVNYSKLFILINN